MSDQSRESKSVWRRTREIPEVWDANTRLAYAMTYLDLLEAKVETERMQSVARMRKIDSDFSAILEETFGYLESSLTALRDSLNDLLITTDSTDVSQEDIQFDFTVIQGRLSEIITFELNSLKREYPWLDEEGEAEEEGEANA